MSSIITTLPTLIPDDPNQPHDDGWTPGNEDTIDSWDRMGQEEAFAGRIISMPDSLKIDLSSSSVRARAQKLDELGMWAMDYSNRFTNQSPTHECTCHALIQNLEIAWNRMYELRPKSERSVFFSPMYSYRVVHGSNWRGGDSMQRTMRGAMTTGAVPEHAGRGGVNDQKNRFKFTVAGTYGKGNEFNSSGDWMTSIPSECDQWNDYFRIKTVINIQSVEEAVMLLLQGYSDGGGRNGHAIPHAAIRFDSTYDYRRAEYPYIDSYDVIRIDSYKTFRSAVSGMYCVLDLEKWPGAIGSEPWLKTAT